VAGLTTANARARVRRGCKLFDDVAGDFRYVSESTSVALSAIVGRSAGRSRENGGIDTSGADEHGLAAAGSATESRHSGGDYSIEKPPEMCKAATPMRRP